MISCEVLVNVRKKILNEVSSEFAKMISSEVFREHAKIILIEVFSEHAKLTRSFTGKYFYLQRFPSRSPVVTDHN